MFKEIAQDIIKVLGQALDFILRRREIIEQTGLTQSQVHNALYRMKLKGWVDGHSTNPQIPRGFWKLKKLYRKFRHIKRIVETRQSKKRREWNCDCEATSEGFVPYIGQPLPPERPAESFTTKYGGIINPKLELAMLEVLGRNGIVLTDRWTSIEPTDTPRFFRVPKFSIEGSEWLDEISAEFDPKHEVEVVFQNDIGVIYGPNQGAGDWTNTFTVSEDEF